MATSQPAVSFGESVSCTHFYTNASGRRERVISAKNPWILLWELVEILPRVPESGINWGSQTPAIPLRIPPGAFWRDPFLTASRFNAFFNMFLGRHFSFASGSLELQRF
jgi:hypothetical protein